MLTIENLFDDHIGIIEMKKNAELETLNELKNVCMVVIDYDRLESKNYNLFKFQNMIHEAIYQKSNKDEFITAIEQNNASFFDKESYRHPLHYLTFLKQFYFSFFDSKVKNKDFFYSKSFNLLHLKKRI